MGCGMESLAPSPPTGEAAITAKRTPPYKTGNKAETKAKTEADR
jgi:hypothetical protein